LEADKFSTWLESLSDSSRVLALAMIYSQLTVNTREMFFQDWYTSEFRRKRAIEILHGLNEVHHTISSRLMEFASSKEEIESICYLGQALQEIESQYKLENFLTPAIEFAKARVAL
jgi:hypothetical protein